MIALNQQTPEKQLRPEDLNGHYQVKEIFPTIQGEGPYVGRPAVFIRMAGCNLQCDLCDTDYISDRLEMTVGEIADTAWKFANEKTTLIVFTGGEPFRQPMGYLAAELLGQGHQVQFETNGTLYDPSMEELWDRVTVICSPKTPGLNSSLIPHISHLKYVLRAGEVDTDGLPKTSLLWGCSPCRPWNAALKGFKGTVYLQPCDEGNIEKNRANMDAVVKSCMEHGYTLCLQVHKLVGLP